MWSTIMTTIITALILSSVSALSVPTITNMIIHHQQQEEEQQTQTEQRGEQIQGQGQDRDR